MEQKKFYWCLLYLMYLALTFFFLPDFFEEILRSKYVGLDPMDLLFIRIVSLMFFLFLVLLTIVVSFLFLRKKFFQRTKGICLFIILMLIIPLLFTLSGTSYSVIKRISENNLRINSEGAQKISEALENYRVDFGVYPKELAELSPEYLGGIPKPGTGEKYIYNSFTNTTYSLSIEGELFLTYDPVKKEWVVID